MLSVADESYYNEDEFATDNVDLPDPSFSGNNIVSISDEEIRKNNELADIYFLKKQYDIWKKKNNK